MIASRVQIESRLQNIVRGSGFTVTALARKPRGGLMYAVRAVNEITVEGVGGRDFSLCEDDAEELIAVLLAALEWRRGT